MPKTVKELREERARLITQARSKYDEITDKTTEARAVEINTEFEAIMTEATALENRANNQELLERAEAGLNAGDPRAPNGDDSQSRGNNEPEAVTYRQAFHEFLACQGEPAGMRPEARAALNEGVAILAPEQRAQIAGDAASGGHVVPDEMMQGLNKVLAAWGPMLDENFCTVLKTVSGGSMPIPGVDDTANEAEATATEGAALTDDGSADVVFTKETLEDYMTDTKWLRVSIQLATSGMVNMEALLIDLLGERLGRKGNRWLTVGTGVGQPLGVSVGAGVGKTVVSDSAFTADEVLEFLHSIDEAYRASPKFAAMFNDNTLLALHKLKDGDGNYLVKAAPDTTGKLQIGAMSVRYRINSAMADIGASARSMLAGDFGRYYVRKIGDPVIAAMRDKDFHPGYGVSGYQRIDGTVVDVKALKALVHPA